MGVSSFLGFGVQGLGSSASVRGEKDVLKEGEEVPKKGGGGPIP